MPTFLSRRISSFRSAGFNTAIVSSISIAFFGILARLNRDRSPAVKGKENIRKEWEQMLALPGAGLSFMAARVEVARSGDLAWEEGTYEFATSDKKVKTTTERGTYVTVWKKRPDGAWKVVADIHNTPA